MTTLIRRYVGFRDEPEIINDVESAWNDEDLSDRCQSENVYNNKGYTDLDNRSEKFVSTTWDTCDAGDLSETFKNKMGTGNESIVQIHTNGLESKEIYSNEHARHNVAKYVSEIHIDVPDYKGNTTQDSAEKQDGGRVKQPNDNMNVNDSAENSDTKGFEHSSQHVVLDYPRVSSEKHEFNESADCDSYTSASSVMSDSSQVSRDISLENPSTKADVVLYNNKNAKHEPQTDTSSTLSYTSFPGKDNFVLVKANDWLKRSTQYDKDGFALMSNFGHVDVKCKAVSRPWLSQFRRTVQRVYVNPNGKVVENISVQDHDGKSYITSYHTNKEMTPLKSSNTKLHNVLDEKTEDLAEGQRHFNHVTCMFYVMILLGTLLVVSITLLVVYTI